MLVNLPGGHRVHPEEPTLSAYLPTAQLKHEVVFKPCVLYLPTGHPVQTVKPTPVVNLPGEQVVHCVALLIVLYCPIGHLVQVELVDASEVKLPGEHLVHTEEPALSLKEPAGQGTHLALPVEPT